MVRGTMTGMKPGTILGHEAVGIVEEVGTAVRNLIPGDRVVMGSTIGCGNCSYCRCGEYAQCDIANPNGRDAGTAFFGGPALSGPFNGMQADLVRVPFANVTCVKLPDDVDDDDAILLSDIFPTAYMAAELAEIKPGRTVAIFGCGPVGQFAIASAKHLGAGRILAIDSIPSRLDMARDQGAEAINFEQEEPVDAIKNLTGGIGADRAIDAVGVDANRPTRGDVAAAAKHKAEQKMVAPRTREDGDNWHPGNAPSQALEWAVKALAKAGTLSIIGVYPQTVTSFPIGAAMNKNLAIKMGNCNHRKYLPMLIELVRAGVFVPSEILTNVEPLTGVIEAYKNFDLRRPGWVKVKLEPEAVEEAA
jgi:threonine dehydrogenase-like Zn-dependent dehydrogenase